MPIERPPRRSFHSAKNAPHATSSGAPFRDEIGSGVDSEFHAANGVGPEDLLAVGSERVVDALAVGRVGEVRVVRGDDAVLADGTFHHHGE